MNRRSLVLCGLSMACASQEAPAKPEAPAGATPPAASADADPKTGRTDDSSWHWRSDAGPGEAPTVLLGVMGQSGIEHCPC